MSNLPIKEKLKKFTCIDECPVRNVLARFSGKWSMLVLCVLAENGATRFNVIAKAVPDISPKVLTVVARSFRRNSPRYTRKIVPNSDYRRFFCNFVATYH